MTFWSQLPLQDESNRVRKINNILIDDAVKNDMTERFVNRLKVVASSKQNYIMSCFGPQGYGKSYTILFILEKYCSYLGNEPNIDNVCFTITDLAEIIEKGKRGEVFILDEQIHTHGYGSKIEQNILTNIERVVRAHKLSFFFIAPEWIKHTYHNYIEMWEMGSDVEWDFNRSIENQWKYTKSIIYDYNSFPLGYIVTGTPSNGKFLSEYESKKDGFVSSIRAMGGATRPMIVTKSVNHLMQMDEKLMVYNSQSIPMTFREMYSLTRNKAQKRAVVIAYLKGRMLGTAEIDMICSQIDMMVGLQKLGSNKAYK